MIKIIVPIRLGSNAIFLYDFKTQIAVFDFDNNVRSERVKEELFLEWVQNWLVQDSRLTRVKYGWDNFNIIDDLKEYLNQGDNFFIMTIDGIPTHERRAILTSVEERR